MIDQISEYIKNIAMFLIFMAFIGIIMPDTKYKGYIDVVMGLVLILIVLGPVLPMLGKDEAPFKPLPVESTNVFDDGKGEEYYDGVRRGLVRESYVMTLRNQLEELLKDTGYLISLIDVDYDEDTGMINDLSLYILEQDGKKAGPYENKDGSKSQRKLIRIEPIGGDGAAGTVDEEIWELKNIKKLISGFYNLSVDNIHITVQKEKEEKDK